MEIQIQDIYHGAVLTQIAEHSPFKALYKVDSLYGHYLVNHNTRLFVKYLTKKSSPGILSLGIINYNPFKVICSLQASAYA